MYGAIIVLLSGVATIVDSLPYRDLSHLLRKVHGESMAVSERRVIPSIRTRVCIPRVRVIGMISTIVVARCVAGSAHATTTVVDVVGRLSPCESSRYARLLFSPRRVPHCYWRPLTS